MSLEDRIAYTRERYAVDPSKQDVEVIVLMMRMNALFPLTEYQREYDSDRYYSVLTVSERINKWKPVYERLLKLKAFL